MPIRLFPVTDHFAAEVGELDLSQPLAEADIAAVREAFTKYAVLVFPAQQLTGGAHLEFAKHFGKLETDVLATLGRKARVSEQFADVSNMDATGRVWDRASRVRLFQMGNRLWHTDSSFKSPTAYASMLYARSIPPIGGHTEFADLRAAYAALPAGMKQKLDGLHAHHSLMYSRAKLGFTGFSDAERQSFTPVRRPLVRTIAETGAKSLYIASHAGVVEGLSEAEGTALLKELTDFASQRQFVYTHRWRVGDLVMWDNRCTMHRGTEFEDTRYPRDMQRATTSDSLDAFGSREAPVESLAEY